MYPPSHHQEEALVGSASEDRRRRPIVEAVDPRKAFRDDSGAVVFTSSTLVLKEHSSISESPSDGLPSFVISLF